MLTEIDREIIMGRWAYDPRYMAVGAVNMDRREAERTVGDMRNSTGIVGCVKHRIETVHGDGRDTIIHSPVRVFFNPSDIAVY